MYNIIPVVYILHSLCTARQYRQCAGYVTVIKYAMYWFDPQLACELYG